MPITIKELLAADTISQAVDKINFNFDQLLLNGGGPVGPAGPVGPPGPIGGRGLRGTIWFEDPNPSPGTDPNTLIFVDVLEGDSYLQSDGTVWEYNGVAWVATVINLTGPQGPTGSSNGFEFFNKGGSVINGERVAYPGPMPSGVAGGANTTNEGVSSVMIGGVVSITTPDFGGGSFTSAYQIDNNLAYDIQSDIVSLFIHQKDSSSKAIYFHGGGAQASDKFEQSQIGNLSNMALGLDDRLIITVPKPANSPINDYDLIGFEVNTTLKSQRYSAGKSIEFITGGSNVDEGVTGENTDFRIELGDDSGQYDSKFEISSREPAYDSLMQFGGGITVTSPITVSPTRTGTFYAEAGDSYIYTSGTNNIVGAGQVRIRSNGSSVNINSVSSSNITNTGSGGININQNGSTGEINLTSSGGDINITQSSGNDVDIVASGGGEILLSSGGGIRVIATGSDITETATNITSTASTGRHRVRANGAAQSTGGGAWASPLNFEGFVSPSDNGQYYGTVQNPAVASGVFKESIGSFYNITINWQKIGNVISCTGYIDANFTNIPIFQGGYSYPFVKVSGSSSAEIGEVYGTALVFHNSILYTAEIFQQSNATNTWNLAVMTNGNAYPGGNTYPIPAANAVTDIDGNTKYVPTLARF